MSAVWFRRFADIPGVRYQTPADVDLQGLERRNAVPKVQFNEYTQDNHLFWETATGGTSQSPAGEHAFGETKDATTAQVLTNIAETLELPGTPSDYHFALQGAATGLYSRRRSDPSAIDQAHRLFLFDVELLQAQPQIAKFEHDGQERFFSILGLPRLLRLYLTEGRVAEAAAVADIAERFGAGAMPDVAAARARAAALAAEDAS